MTFSNIGHNVFSLSMLLAREPNDTKQKKLLKGVLQKPGGKVTQNSEEKTEFYDRRSAGNFKKTSVISFFQNTSRQMFSTKQTFLF